MPFAFAAFIERTSFKAIRPDGVYTMAVSGSGGDTGYDYQANAIAYVSAHALAGQPLAWFDSHNDVPASWLTETGGPGDDIRIICVGASPIEVQVKHGLERGEEYDNTLQKLVCGLQNSPELRAVLLVDRHASEIIREDLKQDIIRLGQGRTDGIKSVTRDLLKRLDGENVADPAVFARLRIVVVDLDAGADGVAAAQALLSSVVEPYNSTTAYNLLGKRGHGLIKNCGRDDVHKCARYLNEEVGLARNGHSPAISTTRFAEWVRSSNQTFYSPALMRHFPVQYAWTRVAPLNQPTDAQMTTPSPDRLEMQIKRYQEWARLTRGRWGDDAVAADAFVDSHRLSAIVGGPGAGKTTLCKRLAFFTSEGRLVVYVRLGTVSALLGHGSTFENAMIEAGLESSGQLVMDRRHILASADLLIADGLDECDPRRADVAIDISRWAQSHPNTSICVLTRPVGHDPGLLPGFSHAELLPLDDDTIRDVASWMIESQCGAGRTPPLLHPFLDAVKEGHQIGAASIAARNPLFLSFLVRLFIDGQDINAKRNVLFSRIVELIRKSPPLNRASPEGQVDSATAWATAEITGWSCLTQPDRPVSEIYSLIARQLGGGIDVARRAESAVHLWTEHGLIELVTAGSLDAVVFVHPALGEYLAGRHLAQLDASDFTQAISDHRPKARWREPIVLAAGSGAAQRVVDTLLALDSPDDPESGEAFLAASAIAESEFRTVAEDAIEKVAAQLKLRLCSPIPLIAVDAGLAIAEVAPMIPEMAAAIALELWDHSQPWSRLAAICSGISGGSPSIPVGKIVEWIEQLKPMHFFSWGPDYPEWPSGTYKLQASALPNALKRIATELPASVAEKIVTAFLSRGDLASGLIDAAQSKLNEKPYSDWVYRARRQWIDSTLEFVQTSVKASQALTAVERTIQECIIRACGRERDTTFDRPSECRLIGTLLSSMEYWEVSLPDLKSVGTEASPVLVETLRGMIHALDLDPDKLSYEANWLLNRPLDTSGIPERSRWQAQQLKRDPDWRKARDSKPDVNLLADALQHPSRFVAWNAARLFAACGDAPSRRELLRNLMFNGQGWALRLIDMLASSVWGEEAFGEIHGRFGKPLCPGCGYLYKPMLRAAGNLEQVQLAVDTALNGAAFDDPRTAELAAEALRTVPAEVLAPHGSRALELLDIWKSRGSWCYGCKRVVPGSSCENCHIVPPQPREHLVYLAFKAGALNFQDLLKLANEEGFSSADAATKSLAQWAFTDPKIMREVIEQIDTESAPKQLIKEILGQPADQLRKNSDELLTLLNSHSAVARARIIESFSYGWVAADLAKTSAKNALEDVSPFVRSAAAKFLWAQSEI